MTPEPFPQTPWKLLLLRSLFLEGELGLGVEITDSIILLQMEAPAKVTYSVIPAEAGIQNRLEFLDSGSRFACPE